jgi:hypothetical protein
LEKNSNAPSVIGSVGLAYARNGSNPLPPVDVGMPPNGSISEAR